MSEIAHELVFGPAGAGTVINVTLSPHHGMPGMAHSGAARATVEALTRELAGRWAVVGGHGDGGGGRALRDRGHRQVPRERPGRALRGPSRFSAWGSRSSTRGSSRCSPRRWGGRSTARPSPWTAAGTTGTGHGRPRALRARAGRCPVEERKPSGESGADWGERRPAPQDEERWTGLEPASSPWKGEALPLSYHRAHEPSTAGGSATVTVCTNHLALADLAKHSRPVTAPQPRRRRRTSCPPGDRTRGQPDLSPRSRRRGARGGNSTRKGRPLGEQGLVSASRCRDVALRVGRVVLAFVGAGMVGGSCLAGRAARRRHANC